VGRDGHGRSAFRMAGIRRGRIPTANSSAIEAESGHLFEEPSVCDTKINQRPIVKPGER
jgi:hypothetical protein